MFELFEDKQRAKLGGADACKMHPLFQALCLIICSEILPYLNKTADSDVVFRKVSPLAIFAGHKIGKKYHAIFSGKEAPWTKRWTRGGAGGPKGVAPHDPCTWPRAPPPKWASGTVSPPVFDVHLHI